MRRSIDTTARRLRDSTIQHRMMSSERANKPFSSSKKKHPPTTPVFRSSSPPKLPSIGFPSPITRRGGPIDAHIAHFHATHRNGVPTTPRSQAVLQGYLRYDRGMASPLVRTHSPLFSWQFEPGFDIRFSRESLLSRLSEPSHINHTTSILK
jgi:hypothetical protein